MNTQTFNHTSHKCRKKLLSWLLVLCLCLGLLPTAAWADETSTSKAELTYSIAEPKAGETPAQIAESLTDGIKVSQVRWKRLLDTEIQVSVDEVDATESFECGQTYLLIVDAFLDKSYQATNDDTVNLSGSPAFF